MLTNIDVLYIIHPLISRFYPTCVKKHKQTLYRKWSTNNRSDGVFRYHRCSVPKLKSAKLQLKNLHAKDTVIIGAVTQKCDLE